MASDPDKSSHNRTKIKRLLWKISQPTVLDTNFNKLAAAWAFLLMFAPITYGRIPLAWLPMLLTALAATIFHLHVIYTFKKHDNVYFYSFYYDVLGPLLMFTIFTFGLYGLLHLEVILIRIFSFIPLVVPLYYLQNHVIAIQIDDSGLTLRRVAGKVFIDYKNIDRVEAVEEDHSGSQEIRHIVNVVYVHTKDNRLIKLAGTNDPEMNCHEIARAMNARL